MTDCPSPWLPIGNPEHSSDAECIPTSSNVTEVTSDYTITSSDGVILADASSGSIDITLPAGVNNKYYIIKKTDSSANSVTIVGTIDGDTNKVITQQYESLTIIYKTNQWWIL
jgi:transcription elongation factor